MKVIIIEDESRAANHLERLLQKVAPEMEVIARLETARDSVAFLSGNNNPELIFSDIQLADGISFEIFRQVKINCPIIFTTAWDHYAIEAFTTNGIDYLLKPIEEERLKKAIEKARQFSQPSYLDKILNMIRPETAKAYKSRFLIKIGDKIKTIPAEDILAFYAMDKATYLHTTSNRSYAIDYTLEQLESITDPAKFFRINRKHTVSLKACENIVAWSNSRLRIKVSGLDDQEMVVAREKVQDFKDWLDQ
jgi:DNA-binding LytR/AlgR family response regulator